MASRTTNGQEFETTVEISESDLKQIIESNGIQYKFFVAQKSSINHNNNNSRPLFLKFIEYNWRQLDIEKLNSNDAIVEINDKWPSVDLENRPTRIDSGWLIDEHEHEIQFHFFDLPLELWSRGGGEATEEIATASDLTFSIVPLKHTSKGLTELKDYLAVTNVY